MGYDPTSQTWIDTTEKIGAKYRRRVTFALSSHPLEKGAQTGLGIRASSSSSYNQKAIVEHIVLTVGSRARIREEESTKCPFVKEKAFTDNGNMTNEELEMTMFDSLD